MDCLSLMRHSCGGKNGLCDCDKPAVGLGKTGMGFRESKQKQRPESLQLIHQLNHVKMSYRGKIIIMHEHKAPQETVEVLKTL